MTRDTRLFWSARKRVRWPSALGKQSVYSLLGSILLLVGCSSQTLSFPSRQFDLLVRGGTVYDGSGEQGKVLDVGVIGDRIVAMGELGDASAALTVDAHG
ncbi:MAG: hypothetical protein AAF991_08065, partial [Pseudomonadota bacterium]